MKLTPAQLRSIIKEEYSRINEAVDISTALSAGSLKGIGQESMIAAFLALSDADFNKLFLVVNKARNRREDEKLRTKAAGLAGKMSPASVAKKINASLSNYNWSWAGGYETPQRDAVNSVIENALGPGAVRKFEDALYYYDADPGSSDAYRKMSPADAKRKQKSAMETLARIAGDLEMA